jgi:hypothetical protein
MTREIVFVHGRSQENKDAAALKQEWVDSLNAGLNANDPPLPPISADRVRFPYYGNTLYQLAAGVTDQDAPDVVLKGEAIDAEAREFMVDYLDQVRAKLDVTDQDVAAAGDVPVTEKGFLNWPWVRAIMQALDSSSPTISGLTIALATHDVYVYLKNSAVRNKINSGMIEAMTPGVESVVVGHSLGSIVSYHLLQAEGTKHGWNVPQFITVGAPLGVTSIREGLPGLLDPAERSNYTPKCVRSWYNAMDPLDAVSLYPLDAQHFPLRPPEPTIENKMDVKNPEPNHHGIRGYLGDPVVAKRIHDAMHED